MTKLISSTTICTAVVFPWSHSQVVHECSYSESTIVHLIKQRRNYRLTQVYWQWWMNWSLWRFNGHIKPKTCCPLCELTMFNLAALLLSIHSISLQSCSYTRPRRVNVTDSVKFPKHCEKASAVSTEGQHRSLHFHFSAQSCTPTAAACQRGLAIKSPVNSEHVSTDTSTNALKVSSVGEKFCKKAEKSCKVSKKSKALYFFFLL